MLDMNAERMVLPVSGNGPVRPAPTPAAMPLAVRVSVGSLIALFCGGAVYLLAVRGTALMLDMAQFAGNVLCF